MSTAKKRVTQTAILKYLNRRYKVVVCEMCGTSSSLTVDHVIPLVSGGKNDETNIRILCLSCQRDYHGTATKKKAHR